MNYNSNNNQNNYILSRKDTKHNKNQPRTKYNNDSTWHCSSSSEIVYSSPVRYSVRVISKSNDINSAVEELRRRCIQYPVVGLDCEWTPVRKKNQKPDVALLQIATIDGYCVLFRTCYLEEIPPSLFDFLTDKNILKVGVGVFNDAKFLTEKYPLLKIKHCFDIRFLIRMSNIATERESLGALTKAILQFELKKDDMLEYRWESSILKDDWVQYAALDAFVGVLIFCEVLPYFHEQQSDKLFSEFSASTLIQQYFTNPGSLCHQFLNKKC